MIYAKLCDLRIKIIIDRKILTQYINYGMVRAGE